MNVKIISLYAMEHVIKVLFRDRDIQPLFVFILEIDKCIRYNEQNCDCMKCKEGFVLCQNKCQSGK